MKEIITDAEQLSIRCDEIDTRKDNKLVREIVVELKEVIREKNLTSLSANQIGYGKRVFVINFNGDLRSFVNPIITNIKGFELSRERCSSLPDKTYIRPRHNNINVTYQTPMGKIESKQLVGLAAIVFQHEIDHLDGLLLSDVGLEIDADYDAATDDEKQQIIKMYLDSLDIREKEVKKEISENEDLKKMSDAISFMQGVADGSVQLGDKVTVTKPADTDDKKEE